jgi:hypothetical protein
MTSITQLRSACAVAVCLAAVFLAGCQTTMRVEPLPGRYTIGLTADDTVKMLRQAGLSDEEVLESGMELRNSLASHGSARVCRGDALLALFVVRGDEIIVSARNGNRFVYRPAADDL